MDCTLCGSKTKVIDSRKSGGDVKRRRECLSSKCRARFTTVETVFAQEEPVKVVPRRASSTVRRKDQVKEAARKKKVAIRRLIEDMQDAGDGYDEDLASLKEQYVRSI